MEPAAILAIIEGALTILEKVAPELEAAVASGDITKEQQEAVYSRAGNLRPGGTAFSGPEWKPSNK